MHPTDIYDYSRTAFLEAYELIKKGLIAGKVPSGEKHAIFLGGQPGAGKSSYYIMREELYRFAAINGDEFRRFHPRIEHILVDDPEHFAENTQGFVNQVIETLIDDLSDKGYDIIIEGTLRDASVPIRTCRLLQEKGYSSDLIVVTGPADQTWEATMNRAQRQKENGLIPRFVPFGTYNSIVCALPENMDAIKESGFFRNIRIISREGSVLYDQHKDQIAPPVAMRLALNLTSWTTNAAEYERRMVVKKLELLEEQLADLSEAYDDEANEPEPAKYVPRM